MIMKKNDGGSAFPMAAGNSTDMEFIDGMSLRDWFAGIALQGNLSHYGIGPLGKITDVDIHSKSCAKNAYKLADAMLKVREGE